MARYDNFLTMVKEHGDIDSCLLWPFGLNKNGYPNVMVDGKQMRVNRLALEYKLGRAISPGLQSCHTCRYRHCFAPAHLYEGTQKQNCFDKIADQTNTTAKGVTTNTHKLSEHQVLTIRELYETGLYTYDKLKQQFDVTIATISRIVKRKIWKHI